MIAGIDTGSSQWNLDFALAFAQGFRIPYVKMGGDNVDIYVAPWYARQIDSCRLAGFPIVGHYWVPDANPADSDPIDTPTAQADYMADRLHDWRPGDFIVLDNEPLDGAWMFTDAGAAEFIERMKFRKSIPGRQMVMYGSWYDLAAHPWPLVLATGCMFIVADYRASSQPAFGFPDIPTIPRDRIIGHQYTSSGNIGGVIVDLNGFRDDAFDIGTTPTISRENAMYLRNSTTGQIGRFPDGGTPHVYASLDEYKTDRAMRQAHNTRMDTAATPQFKVLVPPDPSAASNFQNVTQTQWDTAVAVATAPAIDAAALAVAVAQGINIPEGVTAAEVAASVVEAIKGQWSK